MWGRVEPTRTVEWIGSGINTMSYHRCIPDVGGLLLGLHCEYQKYQPFGFWPIPSHTHHGGFAISKAAGLAGCTSKQPGMKYIYIYILHIYIYIHYVYLRSWFLTYHRNKSNKWTKARMWISWFLVIGIPYNMESYRRTFPYKQWQQVQSGDVGPLAHGPNYSIVQSTLTIELFMGQDFHSYVINNQRVHVYRL